MKSTRREIKQVRRQQRQYLPIATPFVLVTAFNFLALLALIEIKLHVSGLMQLMYS